MIKKKNDEEEKKLDYKNSKEIKHIESFKCR